MSSPVSAINKLYDPGEIPLPVYAEVSSSAKREW